MLKDYFEKLIESERQISVYRTPQFARCLADLRRKGGTALDAAERIEDILRNILQTEDRSEREQFRYTRKGEYRIRHCRKISLGCGYRLVFIQKDGCYVFLYAGSHDDCFRWIERNKGLNYEVDHATHAVSILQEARSETDELPDDVLEEKIFVERYEEKLMEQLNDDLLARIFSGWSRNDQPRDRRKTR